MDTDRLAARIELMDKGIEGITYRIGGVGYRTFRSGLSGVHGGIQRVACCGPVGLQKVEHFDKAVVGNPTLPFDRRGIQLVADIPHRLDAAFPHSPVLFRNGFVDPLLIHLA